MTDAEYTKLLKKYHKLSERHVLVVETDMPYPDVLKVAALSDKIRKAGNELVGLMRKNYDRKRNNRSTLTNSSLPCRIGIAAIRFCRGGVFYGCTSAANP